MKRSLLNKLAAAGINGDTHHATIKKEFKAITGAAPTKDEIEAIRALIDSIEQSAPVEMTPDEAMKAAKQEVKVRAEDPDMPGWENVVRVVEAGPSGLPVRVVIRCTDPQTKKDGTKVCVKEREIAAQDVFQVYRCEPCQARSTVLARNAKAKAKRAAAKQ